MDMGTAPQYADLREGIAALCADFGSGYWRGLEPVGYPEEFVAALKEKMGEGGAASKFASLDKNNDGKLSKEEYSGGATETKKRRKKDK